jgi:1,4-alpha-glucan branching enzyme
MPGFVSEHHNERKTLVFDRGQKPTVFAFNFHPTNSLTDFRIAVPVPGKYKVILHTDANGKAKGTDEKVSPDQYDFGGHGRIDSSVIYDAESVGHGGRSYSFRIYLPSRCGVVLSALP